MTPPMCGHHAPAWFLWSNTSRLRNHDNSLLGEAYVEIRQLDRGLPGSVRGRRYAMIEPPQTTMEVPLCHSEAMTGSR